MKKAIIYSITVNIFLMTITSSCLKEAASEEVFISILNQCRSQLKIYDISENRQYLADTYDCSYVSFLPIRLKPGRYKIVAETFQGKKVSREFTKTVYAMELTLEFP